MGLATAPQPPTTPPNAQHNRRMLSVLIVSTLAFTVCFMVWMMFGVIGIPIKRVLNLNATEFGLLTATPVLSGSLVDITGIRSSAFMLLYGVVWVSLIWMYVTEVRRTDVLGMRSPASSQALNA